MQAGACYHASMMQTPTLLLAGAGDLGMRTARLFLENGGQVIGLRRTPPAGHHEIRWLAADLTQADSLDRLPDGISHVLYAPAPGERSEQAYSALFLHGLQNLIAALPRPPLRLVFVSSSAVYGPGDTAADENTVPQPTHFNGRILLQAEQLLYQMLPTQAVVLRLSGIYGPGRAALLDRIRQGQAKVPAQGTHWANRIHIEDAARACLHLLASPDPAPCYIGTDDHPYPIDMLYDGLAELIGAPRPARSAISPPSSGRRLDNKRLRESGFSFLWPDSLQGYARLAESEAP